MSTNSFQPKSRATQPKSRATKCDLILRFFIGQLGREFRTDYLHGRFGTSFRSRLSELNRDPKCPIKIRNRTKHLADGSEASWYWAELRKPGETGRLFPDDASLRQHVSYPD